MTRENIWPYTQISLTPKGYPCEFNYNSTCGTNMQTRRPLNRIPVRLSHIAETRTNIGPGELYEVGARQMEPYLRTTDLVSQMALEQLLKNKIYTTTNKTDLDFDMVRRGNYWQVVPLRI